MAEKQPRAPKPYDPLEKRRLAESIVRELLEAPVEPLPPVEPFVGAGIYAIYYRGDFPLYISLSDLNATAFAQPIYVGKAIPKGRRKGGLFDTGSSSPDLLSRLRQHAKSVELATNLDLKDFACRWLVVDDVWISLAESMLIDSFKPLWNVVVDGFGNHDVGKGRHQGEKSMWDVLHPGRKWAEKLQPGRPLLEVQERVRLSLASEFVDELEQTDTE